MNATELRIGNYVKGSQVSIPGVMMIDGMINGRGIGYFDLNLVKYKPIPLTEEWLVKFGFTLHKDGMYWQSPFSKDLTISKFHTTEPIFYFVHENHQLSLPDIKLEYVHQLQNLYFALTGKELELVK